MTLDNYISRTQRCIASDMQSRCNCVMAKFVTTEIVSALSESYVDYAALRHGVDDLQETARWFIEMS